MRAYRKEKDSPSFIEDQRIALKEFDKKAIIAVIDKSGQPASVVTSAISISLSEIPGVAVTAAPDSATLATVSATAPRNIAATPATAATDAPAVRNSTLGLVTNKAPGSTTARLPSWAHASTAAPVSTPANLSTMATCC